MYAISLPEAVMLVVFAIADIIIGIYNVLFLIKNRITCKEVTGCQNEECRYHEKCKKAVLSDRQREEMQKDMEEFREWALKKLAEEKPPESRADEKKEKKTRAKEGRNQKVHGGITGAERDR